jgi:two-component system NtrC family sensor kinase
VTRRGPLLLALAVSCAAAGAVAPDPARLGALRGGARARVSTRLAGTAALTRDAERVGARTAALGPGAAAAGPGSPPPAVYQAVYQAGYQAADGRPVLAAAARVPGTARWVERRVDAAEIDAFAWSGPRSEGVLLAAVLAVVALGGLASVRTERARRLRDQVGLAVQREAGARALQASEAGALAFVEHAPYGICRVSPDGRFTTVNPALVDMLGYATDSALCAADLGQIYADPAVRAQILAQHAAGEAVVSGLETVWRRADGEPVPVRLHSREVRDPTGGVAYYEAYVTDLRALRSAEAALRQAEKLAAVGGFVSGVAHELNNPLSAVLLFTDGLLDDPDRPPDDREALTHVREQALRARAIVRDLLAFVRGAGRAAAPVDARDVLEGAARALTPQLAAAGARLDVALAPDLGWVRVDRLGIEQVVTNLVLNAVQAAPRRPVRLSAARAGGTLRVTVQDEGPGLAPEVLARMFEPFFTTKPVGMGTGLGLSVSLGIVERHGGALTASNRGPGEGGGACLTFTLPLVAPPADVVGAEAAEPPRGRAAGRPPGRAAHGTPERTPRVLVVDDEAPIRLALVRFFSRRGWAVDESGDVRGAFARLLDAEAAGAPYDLVLSDLRMPNVSGVALHDWVARTRPAMLPRLVFATGDLASPESAAFVHRTRCQVLEKPFDPDALDALARRALGDPAGSPDAEGAADPAALAAP